MATTNPKPKTPKDINFNVALFTHLSHRLEPDFQEDKSKRKPCMENVYVEEIHYNVALFNWDHTFKKWMINLGEINFNLSLFNHSLIHWDHIFKQTDLRENQDW